MQKVKQHGEVALFIVIFAALLMTVLTVSYVGIMMKGQQQATAGDLSQSAFDSVQAGVEDAKRAILKYKDICDSGGNCSGAFNDLNSTTCNNSIVKLLGVGVTNNEIQVGDSTLNQAYTCVTVVMDTDDVEGYLSKDESKVIPLRAASSSSFDTVKIEWYTQNDLTPTSTSNTAVTLPSGALLTVGAWRSSPPIMRTQFIQFNNSFSLTDFDNSGTSNNNGSNTLFLYPSTVAKNITRDVVSDVRRSSKNLSLTHCDTTLQNLYACTATIKGVNATSSRGVYLRLTSLYRGTHFRISLQNAGAPVKFGGVQPIIDSTGRADNLFRRVKTRVELTSPSVAFPDAVIQTPNNLCKDFGVTDTAPLIPGNSQCASYY